MRTFKFLIPFFVLACMIVPAAALADTATTFNEGVTYNLLSTVTAGDVVICESGVACTSSTPTSQWSDVLVFFNFTKGAFVPDSSFDANTAFVFSDSTTALGYFLANYTGLSSNAQFINENPTGLTSYADGGYLINSPETTATPEPGSLILLASGLLGMAGFLRRKIAA